MLYVGLDLSRKRLDWQALDRDGRQVEIGAVPPDADGLARLSQRLGRAQVVAVIESMSGARASPTRRSPSGSRSSALRSTNSSRSWPPTSPYIRSDIVAALCHQVSSSGPHGAGTA
jgi:hypothetical protein